MATIKSNTVLTSRSICDYNCIFELQVLERKGNFATCVYNGETKRYKIRELMGEEYIRPENYSMAPSFRAN